MRRFNLSKPHKQPLNRLLKSQDPSNSALPHAGSHKCRLCSKGFNLSADLSAETSPEEPSSIAQYQFSVYIDSCLIMIIASSVGSGPWVQRVKLVSCRDEVLGQTDRRDVDKWDSWKIPVLGSSEWWDQIHGIERWRRLERRESRHGLDKRIVHGDQWVWFDRCAFTSACKEVEVVITPHRRTITSVDAEILRACRWPSTGVAGNHNNKACYEWVYWQRFLRYHRRQKKRNKWKVHLFCSLISQFRMLSLAKCSKSNQGDI